MTNDDFIVKAAKALGDKNRLKIVKELAKRGTMNCSETEKLTSLAQPTMSHHIQLLVESGLVSVEKEGRTSILSLNQKNIEALTLFLGKVADP